MRLLSSKAKWPKIISAGCFVLLVALLTYTSPFEKIGYAILFFALLTFFLLSFGYTVAIYQFGTITNKIRYKIVFVSLFVVIFLMLRSTQSLTWVDALVLLLIIFGLFFYTSRRTS